MREGRLSIVTVDRYRRNATVLWTLTAETNHVRERERERGRRGEHSFNLRRVLFPIVEHLIVALLDNRVVDGLRGKFSIG